MKIGQDRSLLTRRVARLNSLGQIVLLLIAVGYWWVQIAKGDYYHELAENNRLRQISLEAPRGLIYDRHGRQLVDNIPGYALLFDRGLAEDVDESLAFAAGILALVRPRDLPRSFRNRSVRCLRDRECRGVRAACCLARRIRAANSSKTASPTISTSARWRVLPLCSSSIRSSRSPSPTNASTATPSTPPISWAI